MSCMLKCPINLITNPNPARHIVLDLFIICVTALFSNTIIYMKFGTFLENECINIYPGDQLRQCSVKYQCSGKLLTPNR
jgi:hypothetical protein